VAGLPNGRRTFRGSDKSRARLASLGLAHLTRRMCMRRIVLVVAAIAVALLAASGVALAVTKECPGDCVGTNNQDRLSGSGNDQTMQGLGADDSISGYRGDDRVEGDGGADAVYGGLGDDKVYGNAGNDYVEGDYGHDYISTGDGADKVAARDGFKDRIVCGQGAHDVVYVDPIDVTQGCEQTTNEKPSP
jgi:Ca2+-binding RTX toxin-like protein